MDEPTCWNCGAPTERVEPSGPLNPYWAHSGEDAGDPANKDCERPWKPSLRFHNAIPGWAKISGLEVRSVPECEGGGYMLREDQARQIVNAIETAKSKEKTNERHRLDHDLQAG